MHNPLLRAMLCVLFVTSIGMAGCSILDPDAGTAPEISGPVVVDTRVIAGGVLVPGEFIHLAFLASGEVNEVLVVEGDQVSQGEILARLGGAESLLAEKDAASLELTRARQALSDLERFADLETQQALQSVLDARLAAVAAQAAWDAFDHEEHEEDLAQAREDTIEAQEDLDAALEDFADYEDLDEDDPTRQRYEDDVNEASKDYNAALAVEERLEVTLEQLALNLAAAEAQLEASQAEYADRQDGPDVDVVEQLLAQIDALESSLKALDAALENFTLTAPFAGTIARVDVQIGEIAVAGKPVISLADLSTWYVETDDLSELEVVRVREGQEVSLTLEALPEESLLGTVEGVDRIATVWQGDVTYTVRIRLEPSELPLRWGMTATAYFEE